MEIGVLILVGGKSTRMGTSKADLLIDGHSFLDHIASKFKGYSIYVSQNKYQSYEEKGYTTIVDEWEDIGPLGGITSCLHQCKEDYIFVIGCDMAFMDCTVLDTLKEKIDGYDCIFVQDQDHLHLLGGIYSKKMFPVMEKAILDHRYALYKCIKNCNYKILDMDSLSIYYQNINTQEDYKKLKRQ